MSSKHENRVPGPCRSENNLLELVLSYLWVPGNQTQVIKFGHKAFLYPLSHLDSCDVSFFCSLCSCVSVLTCLKQVPLLEQLSCPFLL